MERLTKRVGNTVDFANGKANLTDHKSNVKMLFERLAAYEDTGMTPNEIKNKVYRNKWIPTSEELPEKDLNVLVFDKCKDMYIAYYKTDEGWILTSSQLLFVNPPVAWRPLPKPYKE